MERVLNVEDVREADINVVALLEEYNERSISVEEVW